MIKTLIRTERHQIKKSSYYYKLFDDLLYKAKNLYNSALYIQRNLYLGKLENIDSKNQYLSYNELNKYMKDSESYKSLPSCISQQILRKVCTNFYSFVRSNRAYYKDQSKFLGRPRLPKYKDKKKGRSTIYLDGTRLHIKDGHILEFHKVLQGFKLKTKIDLLAVNLLEARIVPKQDSIVFEIIYEKEIDIELPEENKYIAGIDLGLNNFATISVLAPNVRPLIINGKGLKSYNQYFNKRYSKLKSHAKSFYKVNTTNQIKGLLRKRDNYLSTFLHKASRKVVNYLYENKVKHIVIGRNRNWKQSSKLSKKVNQNFIQFPYDKFINILTYKAQELGMEVHIVEESYTSGTSYLDNDLPTSGYYNKSRRIYRGLFKTNQGIFINADVNSAFQITKKIFKTNYKPEYNLNINPIKINIA